MRLNEEGWCQKEAMTHDPSSHGSRRGRLDDEAVGEDRGRIACGWTAALSLHISMLLVFHERLPIGYCQQLPFCFREISGLVSSKSSLATAMPISRRCSFTSNVELDQHSVPVFSSTWPSLSTRNFTRDPRIPYSSL